MLRGSAVGVWVMHEGDAEGVCTGNCGGDEQCQEGRAEGMCLRHPSVRPAHPYQRSGGRDQGQCWR